MFLIVANAGATTPPDLTEPTVPFVPPPPAERIVLPSHGPMRPLTKTVLDNLAISRAVYYDLLASIGVPTGKPTSLGWTTPGRSSRFHARTDTVVETGPLLAGVGDVNADQEPTIISNSVSGVDHHTVAYMKPPFPVGPRRTTRIARI
jgi:hypothetical protein